MLCPSLPSLPRANCNASQQGSSLRAQRLSTQGPKPKSNRIAYNSAWPVLSLLPPTAVAFCNRLAVAIVGHCADLQLAPPNNTTTTPTPAASLPAGASRRAARSIRTTTLSPSIIAAHLPSVYDDMKSESRQWHFHRSRGLLRNQPELCDLSHESCFRDARVSSPIFSSYNDY